MPKLYVLRKYLRPIKAIQGFAYDYMRYVRYGGWAENLDNPSVKRYYITMLYHSLEKSLSFKQRRSGAGWRTAAAIAKVLRKSPALNLEECAAASVLRQFLDLKENKSTHDYWEYYESLKPYIDKMDGGHGTKYMTRSEFWRGRLERPWDFFGSRYSLREFSASPVGKDLVSRAIELALKTPSACNRQPWFVYEITDPALINRALKYQNGNTGFGDRVNHLLIIAADLQAYFASNERYQHWIDGGMFAMSLIYALHSLGVASCPLNWSQTKEGDMALRKTLPIAPQHTVVMMLAIGWPDETNKICVSARQPLEKFLKVMGDK